MTNYVKALQKIAIKKSKEPCPWLDRIIDPKEQEIPIMIQVPLKSLCKTMNSLVLLSYMIQRPHKKFLKFKEPCKHALYKTGESWIETLNFTKAEFDCALKNIAVKKTKTNENQKSLFENAIVIYSMDKSKASWYELNVKELNRRIKELKIY